MRPQDLLQVRKDRISECVLQEQFRHTFKMALEDGEDPLAKMTTGAREP